MPEGRKFLSPEDPEFKERVFEWQDTSVDLESDDTQGYFYPAARLEGVITGKETDRTLETYHDRSLLQDIAKKIEMLRSQGDQRKVKILDAGAGAGLFTEQIRKKFGKDVDVFSTGIRKKAAKILRKSLIEGSNEDYHLPEGISIESRLHKNDLKWRSVAELSDYPEFDFIFDTGGEFIYVSDTESAPISGMDMGQIYSAMAEQEAYRGRSWEYLQIVCKKLLPGGEASLGFISAQSTNFIEMMLAEQRAKRKNKSFFDSLKVFEILDNTNPLAGRREPEYILRIEKYTQQELKELEEQRALRKINRTRKKK